MPLCENCKANLPTMQTRLHRVNKALHALGHNTYHERMPWAEIDAALVANGFDITANVVGNETGTKYDAAVGEGKWLHVSWYKMPSGRFEVTAYVN